MPRISTGRNYVDVAKALPGDRYIATYMTAGPWGPTRMLCVEPIEQLESAIRWAMEMVECMAGPITIMPIPSEDELLRQVITSIGLEGLHWDKPVEEQNAGRDLLIRLGVLKE